MLTIADDSRKGRRDAAPAITPCDNCKHSQRCRLEALACQAYVLFKRCSPSPKRWSQAPRLPSSDLYDRAMQPVIKRTPRPCTVDDGDVELELAGMFEDDE
jgi:hypothetical protein